MNEIEYLLRDAYRGAAQTVRPDALRGLGQTSALISRPTAPTDRRGYRLWMVPLSAAAAVTAIAATIAAVLPNVLADVRNHQPPASAAGAGGAAAHFLAATSTATGGSITIHNSATGATVAAIAPPDPGMVFGSLATGAGVTYWATVSRPFACSTSLYQFRLNPAGQPTALTRYPKDFPGQVISEIAVSRDGNELAYWSQECVPGSGTAHLGVINLATKLGRQWSVPGQADVGSVSLSADGRLLAYSIGLSKPIPPGVYVLRTNAAPGAATGHSRLVVSGAHLGRAVQLDSAVMTPDGTAVYFTTVSSGRAATSWQVRAANVATGHTRLVATGPGLPEALIGNPSGSELILPALVTGHSTGSPVSSTSAPPPNSPSPSGPPVSSTSAPPPNSPSPSGPPVSSTSAPPPDSPSPSGPPKATDSAPSSYSLPATSQWLRIYSGTGSANWPGMGFAMLRINPVTGTVTRLNAAVWQPQRFTYFW